MSLMIRIMDVQGREILDSRGNPTVEAEVTVFLEGCKMPEITQGAMTIDTTKLFTARASVPSGASTGRFEAVELRDKEKRYGGLGVTKAVQNVNTRIRFALLGQNAFDQKTVDKILVETDGTKNKENLGANATLSVSLACARAAAKALHMPLYRYIGGANACLLPVPMMNILNGGKHADNTVDFQEFMIMPKSAETFSMGLRMCTEIYHVLKALLKQQGLSTGVGDEGGFAPSLNTPRQVLNIIQEAIQKAGYVPGEDIVFALDVAASELYQPDAGMYYFPGEDRMRGTDEMIALYEELCDSYPIASIEDGLQEEDWEGWQKLTAKLGSKVQLVGDDLFVTNTKRLAQGIGSHAGNAILVKVNQIGTLTEALQAITMAKEHSFATIISHRSGETEDPFIADLAVAVNAGQIKTGAPCRSDRVCKYNQLLRIEESLSH